MPPSGCWSPSPRQAGTTSPQLTTATGVTFADIPATTYTVTGTITIDAVNYKYTSPAQDLSAVSSATVPLTLVAVTP